ncbi:hypothetical protein MP228_003859 [Amoeboaphelidium protococcarum]|nr:hypothetical protein MP228_003859 [Amoeboaphelidium protococcarum]
MSNQDDDQRVQLADDGLKEIGYRQYEGEHELDAVISLIEKDLSEPYCIYTYRYFTMNFPSLTYVAVHQNSIIACIVGKVDQRSNITLRGYIGMLAVDERYRKMGIASKLVDLVISRMETEFKVDEIVLETEVDNKGAINLYQKFGFIRAKRLYKYYLNGGDAFRLKLLSHAQAS